MFAIVHGLHQSAKLYRHKLPQKERHALGVISQLVSGEQGYKVHLVKMGTFVDEGLTRNTPCNPHAGLTLMCLAYICEGNPLYRAGDMEEKEVNWKLVKEQWSELEEIEFWQRRHYTDLRSCPAVCELLHRQGLPSLLSLESGVVYS